MAETVTVLNGRGKPLTMSAHEYKLRCAENSRSAYWADRNSNARLDALNEQAWQRRQGQKEPRRP